MTDINSNHARSAERFLEYNECIKNDHSVSGSLMARCYKAGDRTGHCVWWLEDDIPTLIMMSLEGHSKQAWPESSPFQQIVCENVGAGEKPVLLGVGMAGKAHWSATIEGDSMTEAIAMDIACRTAVAPERLGSTYWIPPQWTAKLVTENSLSLEHLHGLKVVIESVGNTPIVYEGQKLQIHPKIDFANHHRGQTYRWRYLVRSDRKGETNALPNIGSHEA